MKDELIELLKENLTIEVKPKLDFEWPNILYLQISTKIFLDDELICEDLSSDTIGGFQGRS